MDRKELIRRILLGLKEGTEPTWGELGVEKNQFGDIVDNMIEDGLIEGASVLRGGIGNKVQAVFLKGAKIKTPGHEFLENE